MGWSLSCPGVELVDCPRRLWLGRGGSGSRPGKQKQAIAFPSIPSLVLTDELPHLTSSPHHVHIVPLDFQPSSTYASLPGRRANPGIDFLLFFRFYSQLDGVI
ncbi:hypothetical protein BDW68DRAFT_81037 [Aspergillus falconensis]